MRRTSAAHAWFYDLTERSGDDAPRKGMVAVAFELEGTYVENRFSAPSSWAA